MAAPFTVLVMAAGQGTRMRSDTPKVLHRVAGKSLVEWVVDAAREAGAGRVVAIERDPKLARRLERRCADLPNVRVHERDIRTMPLPRRPFRVVANLPFAGANAVLRRLLHPSVPLAGADVIVELGCARGWVEDTRWLGRHDLWIAARVPRTSFTPVPSRDAAVLVVRPR